MIEFNVCLLISNNKFQLSQYYHLRNKDYVKNLIKKNLLNTITGKLYNLNDISIIGYHLVVAEAKESEKTFSAMTCPIELSIKYFQRQ